MKVDDLTNALGITNKKRMEEVLPENSTFDVEKAGPKEAYYNAERESRSTYAFLDSKFLRNFVVIGIIVVLVLIALQEYFLILAIVSLIFISYTLSSTPPQKVKYEINSHGVQYGDQMYLWNELKHFYFTDKPGRFYAAVDVKEGLPGRLFLPAEPSEKEMLKGLFIKYLPYLEVEPHNFLDQVYDFIVDKFDFDSNTTK